MKKLFIIIVSIIISILSASAQDSFVVKGNVKDTEGNPIPGVVVMIKGQSDKATVTDSQGSYSISIPANSSDKIRLEATCISYLTQTVEVRGRGVINFVLQDDIEILDDAVVVGYGAMRRSDLTGSVTSVKINETDAAKSASLSGLLQGHAAGVQVVNSSAAPDAAVSVRIRGISTFNSSTEPLYVVDGIILNTDSTMNMEDFSVDSSNGLMGINPNDIASIEVEDGTIAECTKGGVQRLIVSYSDARARKNAWNREKGVDRLRKAYAKGTLTKENVNKRGYNKFLDISKDIAVSINEEKIDEDCRWDGLKGYITNTDLPANEVISQYHGLWVVERAFRIGKGTLEMRPMFHFTEKRIEAHICICFIAYKVYKELERVIRTMNICMSVDKVLAVAKTITTLRIKLPNGETLSETLYTTPQQEAIKPIIEALTRGVRVG